MEEYSKSNKPVLFGQIPFDNDLDDEIKLYMPKKREKNRKLLSFCFRICRFFIMVIAFFLIYYCLYRLYVKNAVLAEDLPAAVIPEDTSIEETLRLSEPRLPLIIDESSFEINLVEYLNEDNYIKFPHGDGIKVLIVNSHSSERVSDSLSASDLGEDLAKILESRGVGTYFDNTSNDESGVIGAYARMSEKIAMLKEKYNEAVIVIDIHDSDSGSPFTFTIGATEDFSWEENLRLACNIYKLMKDNDAMFRFLPTSLGQDTGLLTLNIGIGGNMTDDSAARAMLASFADALSQLLQNEPLA